MTEIHCTQCCGGLRCRLVGFVRGSNGHQTDTRIAILQNLKNPRNRIISNLQKTQSSKRFNSVPGHHHSKGHVEFAVLTKSTWKDRLEQPLRIAMQLEDGRAPGFAPQTCERLRLALHSVDRLRLRAVLVHGQHQTTIQQFLIDIDGRGREEDHPISS
jgi:hypothetical protein